MEERTDRLSQLRDVKKVIGRHGAPVVRPPPLPLASGGSAATPSFHNAPLVRTALKTTPDSIARPALTPATPCGVGRPGRGADGPRGTKRLVDAPARLAMVGVGLV